MLIYEDGLSVEDCLRRFKAILPEGKYDVNDNGEFCIGSKELKPIANFVVIPLEKIQKVSDHRNSEITYKFIGIVNNEIVLNEIEVSGFELHTPKWIKKWDLGHFCKIYDRVKGNHQLIVDFLYEVEKSLPKHIEFDTIGWQNYNDDWFYLHSGGVIGKVVASVRTSSDRFFMKKDGKLTPKEAFLGSLDMLKICDPKLTYSLMSYVLTSIVTTPLLSTKNLTPNYVLWIVGGTGFGKTTFSTFFTNIFESTNLARPDSHKTSIILPGLQEHKDCVFIIDDFGTSKTKQNEYTVINKVEDIIRKLTDRQHITEKGSVSHGMVLFTGEKFIEQNQQNASSIRRTIRVKMDNILNPEEESTYDYKKTERFNYHKDKLFFPTSIGDYLEWLSEKLKSNFLNDYKRDFETLRQEIGSKYGSHGRYTDSFAHQIIAFNFFMAYGKERGFITPEQCVQNCNEAKKTFLDLLKDQSETIFDQDVELFLKGIKDAILSKKLVIGISSSSMLDFDKNIYGIVTMEKEQEVLKLDWQIVYNLVSQHIVDSQTHRNSFIGLKKLARLLDEYRLICFNENGSTTPYKALNNGQIERCRVINFRTDMIPEIMDAIMALHEESKAETEEWNKKIEEIARTYTEDVYYYEEEEGERDQEDFAEQDDEDDYLLEERNHREPFMFRNWRKK
ncbi:hypothetical protein ACQKLN_17160 [Paenibacillus glucanolyticus]|uniref:hypothetical protein n=1 Tax=Paenibacillus glucanolyticus TaxID=59843 RepID=UPI00368BA212